MNDLDKMAHLDLHLPTIQVYPLLVYYLKMGSDMFLPKLMPCSFGMKPQHSGNHWYR